MPSPERTDFTGTSVLVGDKSRDEKLSWSYLQATWYLISLLAPRVRLAQVGPSEELVPLED